EFRRVLFRSNPACTWNPASDGRSSETDRCPRGARACTWVQCNEPRVAPLDTTTLGRPAPVVRQRRDVRDTGDLDAQRVQRTHGGFAPRTRALDAHFQRLDAVFHR